jgi:hypothetical protein
VSREQEGNGIHADDNHDDDDNLVAPIRCDYSRARIPAPMSPPPSPSARRQFVVKIVPSSLLSSRSPSLPPPAGEEVLARAGRLVGSLAGADYASKDLSSGDSVRVELYYGLPQHRAEYAKLAERIQNATGRDARAVELPPAAARREKSEELPPKNEGEEKNESELLGVDAMLALWDASSDAEVAVFISDDLELSHQWWKWLARAANDLYTRRPDFDPRVYGIMLERADGIPAWVYNTRDRFKPNTLLRRLGRKVMSDRPFLFPGVGEHAALLFPQHWRRFKAWVRT